MPLYRPFYDESLFNHSGFTLRADKPSDQLIATLSRSKVKTATIVSEAGAERMRSIINKKIDGHHIFCRL